MEKTSFKHSYKEFSLQAVVRRVQNMVAFRDDVDVENAHVKFSYGNRKTGSLVPSVSTIPVADCGNCKVCKAGCYDVRNVCFQTTVQRARANNSAILMKERERYFAEIEERCKALRFFRWHVGGDVKDKDYIGQVVAIAERIPTCDFLIFSKMFEEWNEFIAEHGPLPENLHLIFSDWRGIEMDNPYNLPVSSPVWFDKDGNEIERGPHTTDKTQWCGGFCEECAEYGTGCWTAKKGETILFEAH